MSIIPDRIEQWNLDVINQLIELRYIESEDFDFKGTDMKNLVNHLCAFANTSGGYLVLGIDQEKNNDKLLRFKKNGFKKGKEDPINNEIRNHHVRIEPSPEIQRKIIPDGDKFYVIIKIENNQIKKPYFVNGKGCFVRIGPSTNIASRNTVLNLFSDTNKQIQDLENLKASTLNLKEGFILTIQKFRSISPAKHDRLAKLDLTLFRNNITRCQPFLLEKKFLGIMHESRRAPSLSRILHTLDTLNSYIDGFSNTTNPEIKEFLQNQIKEGNRNFVLCQDLESVIPFLDKLLDDLVKSISEIRA